MGGAIAPRDSTPSPTLMHIHVSPESQISTPHGHQIALANFTRFHTRPLYSSNTAVKGRSALWTKENAAQKAHAFLEKLLLPPGGPLISLLQDS